MSVERKVISLTKPESDNKSSGIQYDENGFKIMYPSQNISDDEIYPKYEPAFKWRYKPQNKNVSTILKDSADIESELLERQFDFDIELTPDKTEGSLSVKSLDNDSQSLNTLSICNYIDKFIAIIYIILHIVFLSVYLIPKWIVPTESQAFTCVIISLILSVTSGLFLLKKPKNVSKITLSILRILTLSQFFMAAVGSVVGRKYV